MYTSRYCDGCHLNRFPEETIVKEGRKKYVIYRCRVCNYKDIEPFTPPPKRPLWSPEWGFRDDGLPDTEMDAD